MRNISRRKSLAILGSAAGAAAFAPGAALANGFGPFNFVRIDGLAEQAVGEEMLKVVYDRAGIEISVASLSGLRALEQAAAGEVDGETLRIFAIGERFPTLKRVPTALSSLRTTAFIKKDSGITITKKEDLNEYRNVIVTGVLHAQAATEGASNVRDLTDPTSMFKLVSAGRADVAVTSYMDGLASLKQLGMDDVVYVDPPLNEQPLFHYVHESHKAVIPVVDAVIKDMEQSGELAEMRKKLEDDYINAL